MERLNLFFLQQWVSGLSSPFTALLSLGSKEFFLDLLEEGLKK